jgi:hypothetical protein
MRRKQIANTVAPLVAFLALGCMCRAAEPGSQPAGGAAAPASQPAAASTDWPQWRGPNRDGVVLKSPKLLDSWPKNGPPLLWKSDFIPAFRDGGCGSPVVADEMVFVYVNKLPVDGGDSFKFVTADLLADWGWMPDIPDDVAKRLEEAWASPNRPDCKEWNWLGFERSKEADLDAFLAKKPEADKYIKDFIATLKPEDAKKFGDLIKIRLCSKKAGGNDGGLTWDELATILQSAVLARTRKFSHLITQERTGVRVRTRSFKWTSCAKGSMRHVSGVLT